jgi:hypothetical protein
MDREIDTRFRRGQTIKRALVSTLVVGLITAGFIWGPRMMKPSLSHSRIRTARMPASRAFSSAPAMRSGPANPYSNWMSANPSSP